MNIEVEDRTFLKQADFKGNWQGIPVEAWCEEIKKDSRPSRDLADRTVYRCEEGWVRPEGSENWTLIGLIRIVY